MTDNQITVAMEKIGSFIATKNGEQTLLRQKMLAADESCMDGLMCLRLKSKTAAFLLSFFLGGVGAGRFYLGDTALAVFRIIATVLTGALSFIPILGIIVGIVSFGWFVAEWFLCYKKAKTKNFEIISNYLACHPIKVNSQKKEAENEVA